MSEIVDAHAELLKIAQAKGRPYHRSQLWRKWDEGKGSDVVGRGFELTRLIRVRDRGGLAVYSGRTALTVVGLDEPRDVHNPRLYVASHINWRTPQGPHRSAARYTISATGAHRLASLGEAGLEELPVASEDLPDMAGDENGEPDDWKATGVMWDVLAENGDLVVEPENVYPGSERLKGAAVTDEGVPVGSDVAANRRYHHDAIGAAALIQPQILGPLVLPRIEEVLPPLAAWVQAQPEVTSQPR